MSLRVEVPEFYEDTEDSVDGEREIKVYRCFIKGFHVTVYPLTRFMEDAKGWEYEVCNPEKEVDWDSLYETSNTIISVDSHNDHARDSDQAIEWAIRTVNEWEE